MTATVRDRRKPVARRRRPVLGQRRQLRQRLRHDRLQRRGEFCYTGSNAGLDTIEAYVDTDNDSVQDNGEPADDALKTWITVVPPEPPPYLLLIDEDSIDNGNPPNLFSAREVNDDIASARRADTTAGPRRNGRRQGPTSSTPAKVGDEGWFAPKTIPASCGAAWARPWTGIATSSATRPRRTRTTSGRASARGTQKAIASRCWTRFPT